jgi:hypothetical protein
MKRFVFLFGLLWLLAFQGMVAAQIRNCDVNHDGEVNIADINVLIGNILSSTYNPQADLNEDGEVNIADVNAIIGILLSGKLSGCPPVLADCNADDEVNIADVNRIIYEILNQ